MGYVAPSSYKYTVIMYTKARMGKTMNIYRLNKHGARDNKYGARTGPHVLLNCRQKRWKVIGGDSLSSHNWG
jgi:hypothetical protein